MMQKNRRYPVGIQTFSEIIQGGYVYVDKTKLVYELVNTNKYYFISRPRRFGKSLLISTLQAYFEGRQELFKGLAIDMLEKEWKHYPVLRFDFSTGKYLTTKDLEADIRYALSRMERQYQIPNDGLPVNIRMQRLIETTYQKEGQQVVVLVDEYDSAMLNFIDDEDMQDSMRQLMLNLFSPLKAADPMLRFVLFTGITRFSQMSIFSTLNNLYDISMDPRYDTLCGISQEEMENQLHSDIRLLAEAEGETYESTLSLLKEMYDGYHFSSKLIDMYNPYSLLTTFAKQQTGTWWFGSGTPTFLLKILRKFNVSLPELTNIECPADRFDRPVERIDDPVPVLLQSGYLTIQQFKKTPSGGLFTLGFPNKEVSRGVASSLYEYICPTYQQGRSMMQKAYNRLWLDNDLPAFIAALQQFFAAFPYTLNNDNERHYQAVLYTLFLTFGADVTAEVPSARGRADLVLKTPSTIYVFELKHNHPANEALQQIEEKDYDAPYRNDGRKIVNVGLSFSQESRNINDWTIKPYPIEK